LVVMSCSFWTDIQVSPLPTLPPSKVGWHFLPKFVFKKTHSLEERGIACSCFLFICTSFKIGHGIHLVCWPLFVFLSQLWMDFVMVAKISSIYFDFCLNSSLWTMLQMHSPMLIVFMHFMASMVAHMRIMLNLGNILVVDVKVIYH
jgi:hypothetical protein